MLRSLSAFFKPISGTREHRVEVLLSSLAFFASLIANYYGSVYAALRVSNPVTDIVLSNTRPYDVDIAFVYGALLLIIFSAVLLITHPKKIPFALYTLSIFWFTRAIFISLTHLAPFPTHTPINFTSDFGIFLSKMFFGDSLFFSGHTGTPFLMALLFWETKSLRYIFLGWSVFFGVVVLLGHIHYTIDVLSAFFITYGVYDIAKWLFPTEYELFKSAKTLDE